MKTLHVIGDSISIHYGPYLEKYLATRYQYSRKEGDNTNLDIPDGANGGDSFMMIEYLRKCKMELSHWDLLVLNCGLHDIKKYNGQYQVSLIDYELNLGKVFDLAGKLSSKIIWIRTTPVIDKIHNSRMKQFERYNSDVEEYNSAADRLCISNDVGIIDLYTFCRSFADPVIYRDHVHFEAQVQNLQAAFIAGHLIQLLE